MQPNNYCQCSWFDTFQFYFISTWRMARVWYLVSVETATSEQIKQSGFSVLFCISCTISVTQFTLCKQFQKFMHFPDSSNPCSQVFWQCSRTPKIDSAGNSCRWYLCSNTNGVIVLNAGSKFTTPCGGWKSQLKTSSNCIHFTVSSPAVEVFVLVPHTGVRHIQEWGSAYQPPVADVVGRERCPFVR